MIFILKTGQSTHKQEQRQASYFPIQVMWFVFLLFVLNYWTIILYDTFSFKKITAERVSCAKTCARFLYMKNTLAKRKQAQTYHSSGKKRKSLPFVVYGLCEFGCVKILLFGELSHISLCEFALVSASFRLEHLFAMCGYQFEIGFRLLCSQNKEEQEDLDI